MATTNAGGVMVAACELVEKLVDIISHLLFTGVEKPSLYTKLSLCLSSGIDHAITNKEVPSRCIHLAFLLKQLYKYKKDSSFEAAFMVLMISVKSACRAGWFSNKAADELEFLAKESVKSFSNPEDVDIGPGFALPYLSSILLRCNPQMRMEKILVSLGVKCGFGAYVSDFDISKDTLTSQHEKICLFVAQMEYVQTSPLVTPPQINLVLNGRTIQKEINFYTGNGPQLVTNVTALLVDGVNLLQAVGQFDGRYVIALATTTIIPSSGTSESMDSSQQLAASASSGIKKYKTSWQISLKCPISRSRITTPVKGNLCRHFECFDLESYLEVNLKEPSWRCPICKLPAAFPDLQTDQRFLKVLKESPVHVTNVIFSKEGSWKPVPVNKDCLEKKLISDILQAKSIAEGKVPVLPTGSSTTMENVEPNNAPSSIGPTYVPLQQHSTNQPIPVLPAQPFPRQGSDGPRQWLSPQNSPTTDPNILKTAVTPTQDDNRIGRMRGSLTGQAYNAAFNRLMNPPIQSIQAAPHPTLLPRHPFEGHVHLPQP